jgi:hypothetical protein
MTMRALDRLNVIQRVAGGNLKPGQVASRPEITLRKMPCSDAYDLSRSAKVF